MEHIGKDLQLTGRLILLRPYQDSDADQLYEAISKSFAELTVWMPWCHADFSIEECRTWIGSRSNEWENGTEYDLAILDSSNGKFLGGCGINRINYHDRIVDLGYWVRTDRTKQGIATEATLLLARFVFEKLNMNRIELVIAVDNDASQRVAEKVGAIREGIMRKRLVVHDKVYDAVMYSFIPSDFDAYSS